MKKCIYVSNFLILFSSFVYAQGNWQMDAENFSVTRSIASQNDERVGRIYRVNQCIIEEYVNRDNEKTSLRIINTKNRYREALFIMRRMQELDRLKSNSRLVSFNKKRMRREIYPQVIKSFLSTAEISDVENVTQGGPSAIARECKPVSDYSDIKFNCHTACVEYMSTRITKRLVPIEEIMLKSTVMTKAQVESQPIYEDKRKESDIKLEYTEKDNACVFKKTRWRKQPKIIVKATCKYLENRLRKAFDADEEEQQGDTSVSAEV